MKKGLLVLAIAIIGINGAFAQTAAAPREATVPAWEWVEVKNPTPVPSANSSFGFGDRCGIDRGGKVIPVNKVNGMLLVRYTARGEATGTRCPTDVVFLVDEKKFSGMTAQYDQIVKAEEREKAQIADALKAPRKR